MESQQFGHEHALALKEVLRDDYEKTYCSRCHKEISGLCFSCVESCQFFLHKACAEAPSQINHPFQHCNHPLFLLSNPPSLKYHSSLCNLCHKYGGKYVYYDSSCSIYFHINCALLTYSTANKSFGELERQITQYGFDWLVTLPKPLPDLLRFFLYERSAEFPLEKDCLIHRKHPLTLKFAGKWFSCKVCDKTEAQGFVYCCSPGNLAFHIDCLTTPTLEDKSHPHPFTLFWKQVSFICNICGTKGDDCIPYMCSTCGFMVHKKCISLPEGIKMTLHDHPLTRIYFLPQPDLKNWDCQICHEEVNVDCGSYYCSDCDFIVHVNCVLELDSWYYDIDRQDKKCKLVKSLLSLRDMGPAMDVIERNEAGQTTKIKHFSHKHFLLLSDKITNDDKRCEGCGLLISSSYFYCLQCAFFLHKSCAELPRKKTMWYERCQQPHALNSNTIFRCSSCRFITCGFSYDCDECKSYFFLRCATLPYTIKHEGHVHPLYYNHKNKGGRWCDASGCDFRYEMAFALKFICKTCDFVLDFKCLILPLTVRHKCDKHILKLTYGDDNDYSESHYCDICEEKKDPKFWFYHCAICDTSVHTNCGLNNYPFIKAALTFSLGPYHISVRKVSNYPDSCYTCRDKASQLEVEVSGSRGSRSFCLDCMVNNVLDSDLYYMKDIFSFYEDKTIV